MSLIDPNLLQLIGLGSSGDPDIADGRHLRWIFHRLLGFPRTGFRLMRRPSLLTIDFMAPPAGTPTVRSQLTRRLELGTGTSRRVPSGLTVSKAGGFVFGPATSGGEPLLRLDRLDNQLVTFDFGAEGTTPPASGELLSNPAAYVLLTIARRSRTGYAVAQGYYNSRPALRLVDRGAVGGDLRVHWPDLAAEVTTIGGIARILSSAERSAGVSAVARREALLGVALARRNLRPAWMRPPRILDPNPFVSETLLLHGGLLERIEVRGFDACILEIRWVTSRDLLAARDWTELQRFYLPITDAPDIYPAWTTEPGEKEAADRLHASPPKRQAPWDREDGGNPPLLLPTAAVPVPTSLDARYLGAEFNEVDTAMREFLRGELLQIVPQAMVTVTERLEPDADDGTGPEAVDVTVSPFDLLYGASADPQIARELGLSTVDTKDPSGIYDYAIEAGFPSVWVQWVVQPRTGRERADRLRQELDGRPADWKARGPFTPTSIASLLTGLRQNPATALDAPAGLYAEIVPDATCSPVQARCRLSWPRGVGNLFEAPHHARVLHVLKRVGPAGDHLLHHRDDETKLLAPHLPTPYGQPARFNLTDRFIPAYGMQTWKVAAMDLFGRLSPDTAVTADVRDTIAPPAVANVEATLLGDATAGPAWTGLVVGFDWMPTQETLAPDLSRFELHLRQGPVGSTEATLPATWGRFETMPSSVAAPVRIAWPSLTASGVPAGVTVNASSESLPGGGRRITAAIAPISCPFDAIGYARLAVAVTAIDSWDNASGFAIARAERVDLSVPPPPTFTENAQRATPADAQNRSWFRVPLPAMPGANVRVLRASGIALLSMSGASPANFAAMSEPNQVGLLKALAVTHREPFASDHERPLPADGGGHSLELNGFDRGFTVIHVAVENRTGTRSPWPTSPAAFLVVAVPRQSLPPAPLVQEVRVGDGSVMLWVAPDVTGAARAIAVYRTRNAADSNDVRRMKLVAEVVLPDPPIIAPTPVIDSGLYDEVDYFYRLVAIGEGSVRSLPGVAIRATPISHGPPPAPAISAIERTAAQPDKRRVRMVIPRRDYPVFLFRRRRFAAAWESLTGVALGPGGALDLSSLAATPDPAGYQVVVEDTVPSPDEAYAYFARIEDPRGRTSNGAPLLEAV